MSRRRGSVVAGCCIAASCLAACGALPRTSASEAHRAAHRVSYDTATSASTPPTSGSSKPAVPTTAAPVFHSDVSAVTPAAVSATWRPGCPVGPDQLRLLHLSYWGFDGAAHTGTIVVNETVVAAVVSVFARLFADRFPIRSMQPEDAYGGSDPASMAADNTSGFNCRLAVTTGPPQWSVHAYGEAIDVNPVENPYIDGGQVEPAAGIAYTDRSRSRPGMALVGGALVSSFAAAGWSWGGRWTQSPDYQHFSATGG